MAQDEDVDPDQQGERQDAHHQAVNAEDEDFFDIVIYTIFRLMKKLAKLSMFWKGAQKSKQFMKCSNLRSDLRTYKE